MKIKVERSGGLAGIRYLREMDADRLPASLERTVRELLVKKKVPLRKALRASPGAADYLNYKITVRDGRKHHLIECNELQMDSSIKSLVRYILDNAQKK